MIGAISETLKNPGFIGRNSDGKIIFIKLFIKKSQPKNVVSVVIERDGLKISISTHEKRDGQIKKLITEAESLQKSSPDHGTVHDERVAEPTQVDDLIIADAEENVKSIFDLVCNPLVRNPLVRDSLTWSGHKLQGRTKWNGLASLEVWTT